jgi:undecaprenyl-diphosphatase
MLFGGDSSKMQAFPSAHTATAFGLAIGLTWLYPRGRWLFATFAVLVACQRIQSGAHFLSDTFFGAALGCVVAAVCIKYVKWFDRFEGKL